MSKYLEVITKSVSLHHNNKAIGIMAHNLKSLNIGKKTTKIILEHDDTDKNVDPTNEIIAIAILLGGYNEFGRKMETDKYVILKRKFSELISEIKSQL